jgi:hypothetical protein
MLTTVVRENYIGPHGPSINVQRYDLKTGNAEPTQIYEAARYGAEGIGQAAVIGEKLYVLLKAGGRTQAAIIELESGRMLYKGEVVREDGKPLRKGLADKLTLLNFEVN